MYTSAEMILCILQQMKEKNHATTLHRNALGPFTLNGWGHITPWGGRSKRRRFGSFLLGQGRVQPQGMQWNGRKTDPCGAAGILQPLELRMGRCWVSYIMRGLGKSTSTGEQTKRYVQQRVQGGSQVSKTSHYGMAFSMAASENHEQGIKQKVLMGWMHKMPLELRVC